MQQLKSISLTQFRNYSFQNFDLDAPAIAISGKNGCGKTNLLDAVYYLCFSKSYFQSKEINNVEEGKEGFRLEGVFEKKAQTLKTTIVWKEQKKRLFVNDVPVERITEYIGTFNALMIAPDDIELINGGGAIRRKFFDGLLSQSDTEYLENLILYSKTLEQKNAYLKQNPYALDFSLLDIYDRQLANSGTYLIEKRKQCSEKIPALSYRFYASISQKMENIEIVYQPCIANADQLLDYFLYNRNRDIEARRCISGLHSEDWLLLLNGKPYKTHASQGQKKSLLISMKLAQMEWLRDLDKTPIVLLDDIFDRLDASRVDSLFYLLKQLELPQIFLSHTEASNMMEVLKPYFNQVKSIRL
ncbi:MAG TPA: DNA replication and repair protein RecF [Edaphocola sp.]|nr:DNA replication and repair protein RecF [Edaphocola sp.]